MISSSFCFIMIAFIMISFSCLHFQVGWHLFLLFKGEGRDNVTLSPLHKSFCPMQLSFSVSFWVWAATILNLLKNWFHFDTTRTTYGKKEKNEKTFELKFYRTQRKNKFLPRKRRSNFYYMQIKARSNFWIASADDCTYPSKIWLEFTILQEKL